MLVALRRADTIVVPGVWDTSRELPGAALAATREWMLECLDKPLTVRAVHTTPTAYRRAFRGAAP